MKYVKACLADDLHSGEKMKVVIEGDSILLSNIDNQYFAVSNVCPHMGASLCEGKLEGKNIICPKHKSVFDVTTGKVVSPGSLLFLKVKVNDLRRYNTKVEGKEVFVEVD